MKGNIIKKQYKKPSVYINKLKKSKKKIKLANFLKLYDDNLFYSYLYGGLIFIDKEKKITLLYNPNTFHGYEDPVVVGKGIFNYCLSDNKELIFFDRHYFTYKYKEKLVIFLTNKTGSFVFELFAGSNPIWINKLK